jgi:predicted DNA-binding transcriptional regulator AlpA
MSTTPTFTKLNTEREEAARLQLSLRTLQAWRTRGDGPAYLKLGKAVRYNPLEVDRWLETRARKHTADPGQAA